MKLSVKSLAIASGILWGGGCFLVALANFFWPSYGGSFLEVVGSVYPGYKFIGTGTSVIVVTLYALVDGFVGGALLAWLYNYFTH